MKSRSKRNCSDFFVYKRIRVVSAFGLSAGLRYGASVIHRKFLPIFLCYFKMTAAVYLLHIHCRIHEVNVFLIQFFTKELHCFPKSLEVDNLPLSQEFDNIVYIRVIRKPQYIIISDSGFLLWERIA